MGLVDDNVFPKLIESMNATDPTAPADASWKVYAKAGGIYARSSNAIVGPFGASSSLTSGDYTLSGNVTMTNAGTYYDGPTSGSNLAAGTWLFWYKMLFEIQGATSSKQYAAKVWDGTTTYDETETDMMAAVATFGVGLWGHGLMVLAAPATIKVSVVSASSAQILMRDIATTFGGSANPGTSHTATRLTVVKIA